MGCISMAKAKQTVSTTKTRVKKDGSDNGMFLQCNMCHGLGVVQKGYNKKKK